MAGIGLLAGCSGGGKNKKNNSNGEQEKVLDEIIGTSTIPPELHWNQFASDGWSGNLAQNAFDFGAKLIAKTGETKKYGYEKWDYSKKNNVFRVVLRDDIKFWNGNQYTSEDLHALDEVNRLLAPESSPIDKIEKVDDLTLDYYFKEPQNPDLLVKSRLPYDFFDVGKDIWGDWMKRLKNASSQSESDKINKELTQFKIPHEELMDKGLGTSPYKLDKVTQQQIIFKKWDGHRDADKIEIETLRLRHAASSSRENELVKNDKIDHAPAPLSSQLQGVAPNHIENLVTWEGKWMIKMLINWRNREYLQDVNVRRAMAAAIDTKNVATNYGRGLPIKVHSGMDSDYTDVYVGSDSDNFIDYGVKQDYELADKFLQRSGYSRKNGTIRDPNGNKLKPLRFLAGNSETWLNPAQTASQQLKQYGFPVKFNTVERSTKMDRIVPPEEMGGWDLSTESHYAGGTYHPISYFDYRTFWGWRLGEGQYSAVEGMQQQVSQWIEEGKEFSPYNGKPLTPEVPTKIGAQNLSGNTEKINIQGLYNEANSPIPEKRTKEIISKLSWAWNYHLPDIDLMTAQQGCWGDTKNFAWPEDKTSLTVINGGGPGYTIKTGQVKMNNK
ncbi:ABC transporter substrate-binding protein [Haladaptatus sp. DFWS20]|uniref:ABC transporter substrate-binding protein n=1 Tax=Haladaptatus sp. DFWS20 TaxID=3403467 RepID=UPI003EBCDA16